MSKAKVQLRISMEGVHALVKAKKLTSRERQDSCSRGV